MAVIGGRANFTDVFTYRDANQRPGSQQFRHLQAPFILLPHRSPPRVFRQEPPMERCFTTLCLRKNLKLFKLQVSKLNAVGVGNIAILDPAFNLTTSALDVFSLTPGFVPTPCSDPHPVVSRQVEDFVRKLQWRHAFSSFSADPPRFHLSNSTRWPPAKCVPIHIARLSRKILAGLRGLTSGPHRCHHKPNLTQQQEEEVANLATCSSTITTADKGGRWTVVPTDSYVAEARRQLSDPKFYRPIDDPPPGVRAKIDQLLKHLLSTKFITRREYGYFRPTATNRDTREFKLLPKLHKESWPDPLMPPGRPIVSDVNSISRKTSELVDFFLQPLCVKLPSHLRDSQHLIAILRQTVSNDSAILFTLDVESLYTSIPINEGLHAVSLAFLENPDSSRPDLTILTLLRLILSTNNFVFQGQQWLQTHGVAMGKVFGGSFANVFLGRWEKLAHSSFPLAVSLWLRFQDDILGLWEHGQQELNRFVDHLNGQNPNIRVKLNFGKAVDFLDLHIRLSHSRLVYSVYFKPTDSHLILPPSSHHPRPTFRGLLYGEIYRFATHSSRYEAFEETLRIVTPVWRAQGYTRAAIRAALQRVLFNTGLHPTRPPGMFPCNSSRCPTCPYANFIDVFSSFTNSLTYPIFYHLSCDSSCVVYVIECSSCGKRYVGQTRRTLRERIREHLRYINNSASSSPLYEHFTSVCGPHNFSFHAISRHLNHESRLAREAAWIRALNTRHPGGLNAVSESEPQPTNLILPYSHCAVRAANAIRRWCHVPMRVTFSRSRNLREHISCTNKQPVTVSLSD